MLLFSNLSTCCAQRADTIARFKSLDPVVVAPDCLSREMLPVQTLAGQELSRLNVHSVADALR